MRKTFWCAAFLSTGLLAGAAALYAAPPHGDPGHMPPHGGHGNGHGHGLCMELFEQMHQGPRGGKAALHAELNLSDAQREAVHETFRARQADIAAAVEPVIEARRALHDAILADDRDDAAIRIAADALGTAIGDAAITFAGIKAELVENAQLTPEQMRMIADLKAASHASIDTLMHEHCAGFLHGNAHE